MVPAVGHATGPMHGRKITSHRRIQLLSLLSRWTEGARAPLWPEESCLLTCRVGDPYLSSISVVAAALHTCVLLESLLHLPLIGTR